MTHENSLQPKEEQKFDDMLDLQAPSGVISEELHIIGHSSIYYYWVVWLLGFVFGAVLIVKEWLGKGNSSTSSLHSELGLCFLLVFIFVFLVAHFNKRNMLIAFVVALVFFIGWWTPISASLRSLGANMTGIFYLILSAILFVIWFIVVSLLDRAKVYVLSKNKIMVRSEMGDDVTYQNPKNLRLEKVNNNFLRNDLIGFSSGNLLLSFQDGKYTQKYYIPNVFFVDRVINEFQSL